MEDYLLNLKQDLDDMNEDIPVVTVKRSDLTKLIESYESLKEDKTLT